MQQYHLENDRRQAMLTFALLALAVFVFLSLFIALRAY